MTAFDCTGARARASITTTVTAPAARGIKRSIRCLRTAALSLLVIAALPSARAQISVSDGGTPSYSQAIAVPPGVSGMSPKLGLFYAGGGVNGPVGYGWSVQGISSISRCPTSRAIDGVKGAVTYSAADKLCLDGQRLIQTDAAGSVLAFPQSNDALGLGTGYREYRTEKDTYARVRAYGYANGDTSGASGPAYFKVWTKSGQIYDYGASPVADANTKALISPYNKTVAIAWAVARISDTLGNFIDFKYEQRDVAWGSGPAAGSPTIGHEWNIAEVQYSGNKVVFNYADRASTTPQDAAEAYHQGSKNVSVRLLQSITTYTNSPNTTTLGAGTAAVAVKTTKLTYDDGPITGRSRVKAIQECAGTPGSTRCLPAAGFTYAAGGNDAYQASPNFNLGTVVLQSAAGDYGVLAGDFNGDGKTDFIRWSDSPSLNQLYISDGTGRFNLAPNGTAAAQFNLYSQNLFKSDGCYYAIAADFNGDGATDVLRIMRATSASGASCGTPSHVLFLSNGDGSFQAVPVSGIDFTQTTSTKKVYYNCLVPYSTGYVASCQEPGDIYLGTSQTSGANFHVIDVNGDGILDIVTTILPGYGMTTSPPTEATQCASIVCSRVFLGSANGTFAEQLSTNLTHRSVYAAPPGRYEFFRRPYVNDVNGDGMSDLLVDSGVWLSRGDGSFDAGPSNSNTVGCAYAIDFNGDGRSDCLVVSSYLPSQSLTVSDGSYVPANVAAFNLKSTGQELIGWTSTLAQNIGVTVFDSNGDGRQDIFRWKDDPTANTIYVSNGDGTFTPSSSFNLNNSTYQLRKSDGSADFVIGDFTGRGTTEFLRLMASPTAGAATANQLYVKVDPTPADQLISATSASGAKTTLYYVPLSNATPTNGVSGSYGARYTSDRGTGNAASGSKIDLDFPMYVVATSVADSGVAGATVATEYSYLGLKADINGRGLLGFRETRRQSPGPNGQVLSVFTTYLLDQPYIGVASRTETRLGTVNSPTAQLLSSTSNIYCDQTVPGAEATATEAAPCPTTAKVQRPYLRQSVETGTDLDGSVLPQVTTTNTFNGSGDPLTIVVATSGSVAGISQTFTKTTSNTYLPDDTSCSADASCNWILARLKRASVQSSVPNSLASIATSAGSGANASATSGNGQTQFATLTTSLTFGSVTVGATSTLSATLTNTGVAPVSVAVPSAASVSGAGFSFSATTCGTSLAVGASCAVTVQFAPNAVSNYSGTLSVATGAGTLNSSLSGSGAQPSVVYQPQSTNWGTVGVDSDSGDWATIKNNSGVSVLITAHTTVSGPAGMWSWQGTTGYCIPGTTVLAPGATCRTFFGIGSPSAPPGSYSAVDQISYQPQGQTAVFTTSQSYSFALATATANVSSLSFSNQGVNSTSTAKSFTLTNNAANSPMNVVITMVGANAANFPMTHTCGTNLAVGASCTITVSFNPTWIANGFSASVQVQRTYPRVVGGAVEGYYYASGNLNVPVSGNGYGSIAVLTSTAAQTFPPTWYGGAAQALTFSYRNDGNAPMTLASPALAAPLSVTSNGCTNVTTGASCSMVVTESTNVAGLSQTQSFTAAGADLSPSAASASWSVYTAVPRWGATSLTFGSVTVGGSASQNITLYNDGNVAYNWAANNAIANAPGGFTFNTSACANVAPNGGNCNVLVTFAPTVAAYYAGSGISMGAASYNSNTFSVTGTGLSVPSISASTGTLSSTTLAPTPASGAVSFTNNGQTPTTLTLSVSGGSSLSTTTLNCPASGSCGTVTVTSPTSPGTYNGTLTMTSSAGGSVTSVAVAFTVQANSGSLSASPASVSLSAGGGLSAVSGTITVTNSGPGTVSAMSLSLVRTSGSIGFLSLYSDTCSATTLPSGASCTVRLQFDSGCPTAAQSRWNLNITGSGAANTAVVAVTGSTTSGICR